VVLHAFHSPWQHALLALTESLLIPDPLPPSSPLPCRVLMQKVAKELLAMQAWPQYAAVHSAAAATEASNGLALPADGTIDLELARRWGWGWCRD
jgi:hypothetical protein